MKKNFCSLSHIQLAFGFTLLVSGVAIGQMRIITGTVTDNGKPVSGVSVFQKDTDVVVVTSNSGAYAVQVSGDNPTLVFRHQGLPEQTVTTDGRQTIDIDLERQDNKIEEVILNAGYYKVKGRESTGSIAKITAKDIENQPVNNALSAIQGRMAGVNIVQIGGNTGGGYDVQIRGRNSLRSITNGLINGNEPLYVINGVPIDSQLPTSYTVNFEPVRNINPLSAINPNDIESIEILKDADATAIYGSRGANGVILVTTNKASSRELTLNLNTSLSLGRVASRFKMMDTGQYVNMREEAFRNTGITTIPANAYDINGIWDRSRYTDWQRRLIGNTSENSMTQLSLSGAGNRNSFRVGFTHTDNGTVYPADFHNKNNILNSEFNYESADRNFSIGSSNNLAFQSNNTMNSDFTKRSLLLPPNAPELYDAGGNLNWENNTFTNPLGALNGRYSARSFQLNQTMLVSYGFWSNWKVKLNAGVNYRDLDELTLSPNTMYNPAFLSGSSPAYSTASQGRSSSSSYLFEPQLSWNTKTDNTSWEALVGATYQESTTKISSMRGTGYTSNDLLENIAAAKTINILNLNETRYRYAALFGRLNWMYKKRYVLNITGRRDGSSRFGPDNRYANFGALGGAWIFSEEDFLRDSKWLNIGKIRASYGITGSDRIGDYQYLDTYALSFNSYNGEAGFAPSRLFNPNFSWERTRKLEVAMEWSLFQDRVSLTSAWYRNSSSNQLVGYQLPATTGFASVLANLGAVVENTGFEQTVGFQFITSSDWQWGTNLNISFPRNRLVAFPGLEGSPYANQYVIGQPVTILKLLEYQGIDPETGKYRFKDANNDGKITILDDAQTVENVGVRYFGGLQNDIRFKNFSLSFLFQFVKQRQTNYFREMNLPGSMNNQPQAFTNVWSQNNTDGVIMPYATEADPETSILTNFLKFSTAAVGDASFIRLKNVQVNYTLPIAKGIVREARIYVQGQNLITWTSYFGLDPEFLISGYLPPLKTYAFGFQLTF